MLADAGATLLYAGAAPSVSMSPSAIGATGGSQAHENMAPTLCVSFIVSLFGIFPSPS